MNIISSCNISNYQNKRYSSSTSFSVSTTLPPRLKAMVFPPWFRSGVLLDRPLSYQFTYTPSMQELANPASHSIQEVRGKCADVAYTSEEEGEFYAPKTETLFFLHATNRGGRKGGTIAVILRLLLPFPSPSNSGEEARAQREC